MQRDVSFKTRDRVELRGWFFTPDSNKSRHPCVVMTHGLTVQIEHGLAKFAEHLAESGFAVLTYDHRGWGRSDGEPRHESDPFRQMHDTRDAITYVTTLPEVDPERIGLWGTSYSGGTALMVAAVDRRVGCVVAVGPLISGSAMATRHIASADWHLYRAQFEDARRRELAEEKIQYRVHTAVQETINWYKDVDLEGTWKNEISVISHDMMMEFEPGDYVSRISPTPLLMVVADQDTRCLTDLQLGAYNRAREPKHIVLIQGGHYDAYVRHLATVNKATCDWFTEHLAKQLDPVVI
ncbi:alpha/beta hydrolase [Bradyrhizobium sp. Arg62]|uniref:alpha/beta hydrolase n=1 Tax=Bradyrhizobium brasilense TaxID=1419277 RepID=UPI001E65A87A|nr:alpha/beta hydrolase [Bradyrhizobium brasilense]MCC8944210.1 alpha/beta hydrolase [Bradyrhizobium brasilense]